MLNPRAMRVLSPDLNRVPGRGDSQAKPIANRSQERGSQAKSITNRSQALRRARAASVGSTQQLVANAGVAAGQRAVARLTQPDGAEKQGNTTSKSEADKDSQTTWTTSKRSEAAGTPQAIAEGGVDVVTIVSENYLSLMRNFILHMQFALPNVSYSIYALDLKSYGRCLQLTPGTRGRCTSFKRRLTAEIDVEEKHYHSPVFALKVILIAKRLRESHRTVVFLDITALVANMTCWDTALSFPQDVVSSSSAGCPWWFAQRWGLAMNTGYVVFRQTSLELVNKWETWIRTRGWFEYCGDQGALHRVLENNSFACSQQPCATGEVEGNISIRFLDAVQWPRGEHRSQGRCLFHPWVKGHTNHEAVFRENGWWYS